jgi:hypothetical protein
VIVDRTPQGLAMIEELRQIALAYSQRTQGLN